MKKQSVISRRRFLGNSALLTGAAVGASSLSLAAGIKSQVKGKKKVFKKAPLFDPSLENYPGYSARIPVLTKGGAEPEKEQGDSLFSDM